MTLVRAAPAARALRLAVKELREVLRDRRTIITLVLMPLLVYPLLGVTVRRSLLSSVAAMGSTSLRIVVESEYEMTVFAEFFREGSRLLPDDVSSGINNDGPLTALEEISPERQPDVHVYVLDATDPDASLEGDVREGRADLGVRVVFRTPSAEVINGQSVTSPVNWTMIRRPDSQMSEQAWNQVTRRLEATNDQYLRETLAARGVHITLPISIRSETVESESKRRSSLITFIPLVLVLMTMTGAVYPAIDLTAGERERGTMEILVAAPVSRMTLLAGKFLAVLVVALLTATINMASMFATLFTLQLDSAVLGDRGLSMIPLVILLMVVFAAFFSAVLLSVTSIARSFKEAQAYLIPLMLVSLTPAIFSLTPELTIGPLLAVTPLVNIVLTGRDLLQGNVNWLMFVMVVVSTALYGTLALAAAARVFGSDSVLYGSTGSWTGLLQRPKQIRPTASISTAALSLAIVFPLFIIVGSVPARIADGMTQLLLLNIIVFLLIFLTVPICIAKIARIRISTGFAIRGPGSRLAVPTAILLGVSLWGVVYELNLLVGVDARAESLRKAFGALMDDLATVPLGVKLAALAIAPAICEELFFRGFLQTSLRQRYQTAVAVVVSAVLFGLFHIIVRDALFLERMIPSTLMGLILGLMLERSGSVLPGMLLHVLHNGLLISIAHYEQELTRLGIGMEERRHLPAGWLAGIGLVVAMGGFVLWRMTPPHRTPDTD